MTDSVLRQFPLPGGPVAADLRELGWIDVSPLWLFKEFAVRNGPDQAIWVHVGPQVLTLVRPLVPAFDLSATREYEDRLHIYADSEDDFAIRAYSGATCITRLVLPKEGVPLGRNADIWAIGLADTMSAADDLVLDAWAPSADGAH